MKIELKLTIDTIIGINCVLKYVYITEIDNDINTKVFRSIGFDLADKFESQYRKMIKNSNIFEHNKKFKMTLKYYESWALYYILSADSQTKNELYKMLILKTANELHQKLQ